MNIEEELKNSKGGRKPALSHDQMKMALEYHQRSVSIRAISRYMGVSTTAANTGIRLIQGTSVKPMKRQWQMSYK